MGGGVGGRECGREGGRKGGGREGEREGGREGGRVVGWKGGWVGGWVCEGGWMDGREGCNYEISAYGIEWVHNVAPEQSRVYQLVHHIIENFHLMYNNYLKNN